MSGILNLHYLIIYISFSKNLMQQSLSPSYLLLSFMFLRYFASLRSHFFHYFKGKKNDDYINSCEAALNKKNLFWVDYLR